MTATTVDARALRLFRTLLALARRGSATARHRAGQDTRTDYRRVVAGLVITWERGTTKMPDGGVIHDSVLRVTSIDGTLYEARFDGADAGERAAPDAIAIHAPGGWETVLLEA